MFYDLQLWVLCVLRGHLEHKFLFILNDMSLVDEGSLESSVSNGAQYVGRNAPGLIYRGTHLTVSITDH